MSSDKKTEFHLIAESKGYTLKEIGKRWDLSVRQMTRVAQEPKQRDLDAVNGIPKKK